MKKWVIITLIIILLGLVALGVISNGKIDNSNMINIASSDKSSSSFIFVEDQKIKKGSVNIDRAILEESGFVVIHESSSNAPGKIIGNSILLKPGSYSDIEISLSKENIGNENLYAMLHKDNGDKIFNPQKDDPVTDKNDSVVFVSFTVSK